MCLVRIYINMMSYDVMVSLVETDQRLVSDTESDTGFSVSFVEFLGYMDQRCGGRAELASFCPPASCAVQHERLTAQWIVCCDLPTCA